MVKINSRFSIEKDSSAWNLYEEVPSEYVRDGVTIKTTSKGHTYYSDLLQVLNAIIDRSCDQADDVTTIINCINDARSDIMTALYGYKIDDVKGYKMIWEELPK